MNFPLLSGNTVVDPAETVLAERSGPMTILERAGEKIAVLSVLATDTGASSSPGPNVRFDDEIAYLRAAVKNGRGRRRRQDRPASHVGIVRDREIAAAVDGIDVIVGRPQPHSDVEQGGGRELPLPLRGREPVRPKVPIVQAYAYSKYLGEIELVFDDGGEVVSATGEPHLLDAGVVPDPEIAARVAELGKPLQAIRDRRVRRETAAPVEATAICAASAKCSMGNSWPTPSWNAWPPQGVEIVITNGGGLRASIDAGV